VSLQDQVISLVEAARLAGTDSAQVEIKRASGGAPKSLPETVSAFANGAGGMIVLGLDERAGFTPVTVNPGSLADALASACADSVEPPVRAEIEIVTLDGHPVVAAAIPPTSPPSRPCYVKTRGIEHGSYIREHDGDRRLSSYEIHLLVAGRGQPRDDASPVPEATLADLEDEAVDRLVGRFRSRRGPAFARFDQSEILRLAGVLSRGETDGRVTLAGLLALGQYPQEFFPQLNVTFVSYPTTDGRPMRDGTRFLENVPLDGSIPEMVSGLLSTIQRSMTRRSVIIGAGREDIWEYPVEAVRELIVNALMHRDYNPLAHGAQVRVEMYPDRLVFINPGDVYGAIGPDQLLRGTISTSRNAILARLLEDVAIPGSTRLVCENRGSGLRTVLAELARQEMAPPLLRASDGLFTAELRNSLWGQREAPSAAWAASPVTPSDRPGSLARPTHSVSPSARSDAPARPASPSRSGKRPAAAVILDALAAGPKPTSDLMALTGLTRPGVGRNLRALERRGLIAPTANRHNPNVEWTLAQPL
jgi:ATP-dependent DNA helicase RecG